MNSIARAILGGFSLAGSGLLMGCVVRVAEPLPPPRPVVVYDDPGVIVYDDYYYRGYYDGPYFFWYGRDGRLFHEMREEHERRERFERRSHAEERHDTPERHRFEQQRAGRPPVRPQPQQHAPQRGEREHEGNR